MTQQADRPVYIQQDADCQDIPLPVYQTPDSSGLDLRAAVPPDEPVVIDPGKWALVPTGIRIAIPPGFEAQVRARSGLALKSGIGVLNGPGTIDADYRGPVGVILFNFSKQPFRIERGDRIAQLVLMKVERLKWVVTDELPLTHRGDGGFGSTGAS
ncbi:MAG: dUTP diphosphatase [Candidatus Sumerlaeia bacterium]